MADQLLEEIEASGVRDISEKRSLVIKWVKGQFPGVELVTTETLQQWMEEKPEELILLSHPGWWPSLPPEEASTVHCPESCNTPFHKLSASYSVIREDTRTPAEFDVSHLPGAILVPPKADALLEFFKMRLVPGWEEKCPNKPIVCCCYCTVGYRSSMAAQLLGSFLSSEAKKTSTASPKIYNVCGGLVAWAVEQRRMVDGQEKPTLVVHPYSPTWAKLLEPKFRAEI